MFKSRILNEFLPAYCKDPKRLYSLAGYKPESNTVSSHDARYFLQAIDGGLVIDSGGVRLRAPQSRAFESLFWEGLKARSPRPITLWVEPVITIGCIARLHFEFGWPRECLGMQSARWEFDVTAYLPGRLEAEYIACEVKKTVKELDVLMENMLVLCGQPELDAKSIPAVQMNAYKKVVGLRARRAPIFWAVGPDGESRVFNVSYLVDAKISLRPTTMERLMYPS